MHPQKNQEDLEFFIQEVRKSQEKNRITNSCKKSKTSYLDHCAKQNREKTTRELQKSLLARFDKENILSGLEKLIGSTNIVQWGWV
jgi:hypothetical protein